MKIRESKMPLRGQLLLCEGASCSQGEQVAVPFQELLNLWSQYRLFSRWNLCTTSCLGLCHLANTALLVMSGQPLYYFGRLRKDEYLTFPEYLSRIQPAKEMPEFPPQIFRRQVWFAKSVNGHGFAIKPANQGSTREEHYDDYFHSRR